MRQPLIIAAFATRDDLMQASAARLADALNEAIAEKGDAYAALSGGSTPETAYALLAQMPLDWAKITFALVDERCVPPDHPASNEAMLRRALAPALDNGATLVPMFSPTAGAPAEHADQAYQALRLDIALMGMGADAHTASWFPGAEGLAQALDMSTPRTVIAVRAPQAAGAADRLTLTRAAVARARCAILLITGDEKRARLGRAVHESISEAPVASLLENSMPPLEVLWAP